MPSYLGRKQYRRARNDRAMKPFTITLLLLPALSLAQRYDPQVTPLTMALLMAQPHAGIDDASWMKMVANPANAALLSIRIYEDMLDTMDTSQLDQRFHYVSMPRRTGAGGGAHKTLYEQRELRGQVPRAGAHGPYRPDKPRELFEMGNPDPRVPRIQ